MSRILLVRHGESVWNSERRIQGWGDPGLSARGRWQAERLATSLAGRAFGALYTSPLKRASQTAEMIAEAVGLLPQSVTDLREIHLGEWEGKGIEEIRQSHGDLYERWVERPQDSPPPGGEDFTAFCRRVAAAMEGIITTPPDPERDILVVAHGGVVRAYLSHILGMDPNNIFRLKIDNASVSEVAPHGTGLQLVTLNVTGHLDGQSLLPPLF